MMQNLVFEVPSQLKKSFSISTRECTIKYTPLEHGADCALKTSHPLLEGTHLEVRLDAVKRGSVVAVGLAPADFPSHDQLPGWTADSAGYHSDDGNVFLGSKSEPWKVPGVGDRVGCGVEGGTVYFTLNGAKKKSNFRLAPGKSYYPTIGFSGACKISYGFERKGVEVKENIVFTSSIVVEGTSESSVRCVGNEVRCENNTSDQYWTAKSNIPIKISSNTTFYFEIKVQSILKDGVIAIGICTKDFPTSQSLPGWVNQSYGYHSDDGGIFANNGERAKLTWQLYGAGDVVGCGIEEGKLYFTRNKQRLETNLQLPELAFYMTVGMEHSSSWTWNFGSSGFVNSSITLNQFKQPSLASANQDHPLLRIPQCVWPLMVSRTLQKTKERHETWQALLSTCQALRDYLLPLFITLSPADYLLALEGYYIWKTRQTDYYLEVTRNKMTYTLKHGSYEMDNNEKKSRSSTWSMKRKVLGPTKQQIIFVTKVFEESGDYDPDFVPEFTFDRYQPTGLEHQKWEKEKWKKHFESFKQIIMYRKCGAAVVTPEAPCCHEAISNIARGIFQRVPRDYEGYNTLMLEMVEVVENLSQECMATAMTDIEIHEKIIENMSRISPDLSCTLKKIPIL